MPVFGMLKRNGKIYTQIVNKSVSYTTIQFSNLDESIIYNEKSFDGLVGYGVKAHYRAEHSKNE